MANIYIERIGSKLIDEIASEALSWIGCDKALKGDSRVFIKPNFTYPYYKEGVTTSPAAIEGLVKALKNFTAHIMVGESDGGYYSWKAEDAFTGHNIYEMVRRYGIKAVNLSKCESVNLNISAKDREFEVTFPSLIKHGIDVFITMPVPKVHCMTGVSLSMKNQWGCIPDIMRLSFHHIFNETILEINKNLPQTFVFADGEYFLDEKGPMYGVSLKKGLIIASDEIGAFDAALCEIMGVDIDSVPHLKFARDRGFVPDTIEDIRLNRGLDEFKYKSTLSPNFRQRILYNCFRSELLTNLLYTSGFGLKLHKVFYKCRKTPEHLKNLK